MAGDASEIACRVGRAADSALAGQQFVTMIDVLQRLGWLAPVHVDSWRQGRISCLEEMVHVNPDKLAAAMDEFERWVRQRGLTPSEVPYVARTPDRRPLRFSHSGDSALEHRYRMHWVSPQLSEEERRRLVERQSRPPELVVISPLGDWTCTTCVGTGDFLVMEQAGPICLSCAGLDHLAFLPAGDAGRTRRAKKASRVTAVVVRFSRTRKRYERQGLLVEPTALDETNPVRVVR